MRATRRLRAEKSDSDLSDGQLSVLAFLEREGPSTPREIAAYERVQPPSMTRTLTALLDLGLVTRAEHPVDRRQVLIGLGLVSQSAVGPRQRIVETVRVRCPAERRLQVVRGRAEISALQSGLPEERMRRGWAMPTALLHARDDAMLRGVMVKLAADRQLILDDGVVSYLASHIERSFAAARAAVAALDQEALRRGRPPSRALAAELFRERG